MTMRQRDATSLNNVSDGELVAEVTSLANGERHVTARLIASLAELDARKLYLAEGCSSLFTYCTQVLRPPKTCCAIRFLTGTRPRSSSAR
jgi:hypothetical protein